jgi:hypothetical protein
MTKKNPHWGTTLNEFLDAEGIREGNCSPRPSERVAGSFG